MNWKNKVYNSLLGESEGLDIPAMEAAAKKRQKERDNKRGASAEEMEKNLANFKPGPRKPLRHKDKETGVVTTTVRRGDTGDTAAALGRGQHTSPPDSSSRKRQDSETQMNWQNRVYENLAEAMDDLDRATLNAEDEAKRTGNPIKLPNPHDYYPPVKKVTKKKASKKKKAKKKPEHPGQGRLFRSRR